MKMQGYTKNYKLEEQKKEFEWKNDEIEEIKFEDEQHSKEDSEKDDNSEGEDKEEKLEKKEKLKKKYLEILNVG